MPADLYKSLAGDIRRGLCFRDSFNGTANSVGNSVVSITGNPLIRNGVYNASAGIGRYITYSAIPNQRDWTASGFTVSFWLNVAQSTFDGTIMTIWDNCSLSPNPGGFYIILDDRGGGNPTNGLNIAFGSGTGGATNRTALVSNCISDSTWEHFVVVCSTTSIAIYKNGVALSVTNTGSGTGYLPTFANMRLGARSSDGSYSFRGMLRDTRVYSGQLTAAEVANLYAGRTDQRMNEFYAFYNFDQPSYDFGNKVIKNKNARTLNLQIGDGSTSTTFPTKLIRNGFGFDGGDYFRNTSMPASFNTNGTIAIRFNENVGTTKIPFILGESGSKNNIYLIWSTPTAGSITMYNSSSSPTNVHTNVSMGRGKPVSLIVSWDASNVYYSVDGSFVATAARPANVDLTAATQLYIGSGVGGTFPLAGEVSSFGITNKTLTYTEHAIVHQALLRNQSAS